MDNDLSGKVAAVTGAASGIGFECARTFLAAGARVAMIDRDGEKLRRHPGDRRGDRHQVPGTDPSGQQGLVSIAESGIGDGQRGLGAERPGETLRAEFGEPLAGAVRCRTGVGRPVFWPG